MTEQQKVENEQTNEGAVEQPNPAVSSASSPSIDVTNLEKQVSELTAQLRGLQGRQDKADDKQQELLNRYDALTSSGKSSQEARAIIAKQDEEKEKEDRLDKLLRLVEQQVSGNVGGSVGSAEPPTSEASRLITEYELDGNSDKVIEIVSSGLSGAELKAALLEHKLNSNSSRSVSAAPSMQSSVARPQSDSALEIEYREKMMSARGNRQMAAQLRAEYQKKGLDTGKVHFTV